MGIIITITLIGAMLLLNGLLMKKKNKWLCYEGWIAFGVGLLVLAIIGVLVLWCEIVYKDVNTEILRQRHDALVMQYEEGYYNKFTYDGRESLIKEIMGYNSKIITGRAMHNNMWIGAFYQMDYDSLPLIELKREE